MVPMVLQLQPGSIFTIWFSLMPSSLTVPGIDQDTNPVNSNCNTNHSGNRKHSSTPTPVFQWTGKVIVMKKGMRNGTKDWTKVTKAQKNQIYAIRKEKKTTAASSTVSVNHTEIQSTAPPITTTTQPTPTPNTVMTASHNVCHLRSNNTSKDSNFLPSQVVIVGPTYTLSYCDCIYSINQNHQRPCGSLIDGGANSGLRGSDVVVLSKTLLTADFTVIADNTLQKVPV
jgi:hypothetical protein